MLVVENYSKCVDTKSWKLRPGRVITKILPVVEKHEIDSKAVDEIVEKCYNEMNTAFVELQSKIEWGFKLFSMYLNSGCTIMII